MKIRNKLTFKRLKKETLVYDYCKEKINKGETFTLSDIAKDLKMGRTSVIEYLQEISNRYNDITYSGGVITLIGVGNSIGNESTKNNEGLIVKKLPRTTYTRQQKKIKVYNYLVDLINQGKKIPCLSYLSKDFPDMHLTTLMEVLKDLDKENKIIYKRGQVVAVNVPNVKAEKERMLKYNKNEEPVKVQEEPKEEVIKETPSIIITDTERYDKAVKELIADYLLNANITTRDEMVSYIDSLLSITDKLKEKLYKE